MTHFTRDSDADANGTELQCYVHVAPAKLIEMFGEPDEGDGCKASMEYLFVSDDGDVVSLSAWAPTSPHDKNVVKESLRQRTTPFPFHLGARTEKEVQGFIKWFRRECAAFEQRAASSCSDCSDCGGSREYVGFLERRPCPTCRPNG